MESNNLEGTLKLWELSIFGNLSLGFKQEFDSQIMFTSPMRH